MTSAPPPDVTRCRRDRAQARDHAGDDAEHARLAVAMPFDGHQASARPPPPCVTSMAMAALSRSRRARAAAVEAEPAHPQHAGAGHGHGQVVRHHRRLRETAAIAEHERGDQRRDPALTCTTVPPAKSSRPSCPSQPPPHAVTDRDIDHQQPQRREQEHGGEFHALGEATDDQGRRDDGEGHLEQHERALRTAPLRLVRVRSPSIQPSPPM